MIRTAVHAGEFSDADAEKHLADVLIQRRDKITSIYLTAVNPVVAPRLDSKGRLTFENAAFSAGVAESPVTYRASWFLFDNATGATKPLSTTQSTTTTIEAPGGLPAAPDSFVAVDIAGDSKVYPAWQKPIRTYFRRAGADWRLIGLERLPDKTPPTQDVVNKVTWLWRARRRLSR